VLIYKMSGTYRKQKTARLAEAHSTKD
jgi:hypothetical protein